MPVQAVLLLVLSVSLAFIPMTQAEEGVELKATPSSFDFGVVGQGELAIARFQIHNPGSTDASIQWMEFSEQGLIAQVKPRIAAGSSVELLVNWNTSNFEGEIEGEVTLGFIHSDTRQITLRISGIVSLPDDEGQRQ